MKDEWRDWRTCGWREGEEVDWLLPMTPDPMRVCIAQVTGGDRVLIEMPSGQRTWTHKRHLRKATSAGPHCPPEAVASPPLTSEEP